VFVKWTRRQLKATRWFDRNRKTLDIAVLVESHRVDGKPRHRTIAYLGSVHADVSGALGRARFYREVETKLAGLKLSRPVRAKIIGSIERRVPRPVKAEVRKDERRWGMTVAELCRARP
jgi:hypothetical protein